MRTYQDAQAALKGRPSRKLENNTWLETRPDGSIAVRLHSTDVVTYHRDGRTALNSGGWQTATTKDRINKYSPAVITQDAGVWYFAERRYPEPWVNLGTFQDGATIHPDGTITGTGPDPKALAKERARVVKFAKGYITALAAGDVPPPGPGDCFYCAMREVKTGKPLGECQHDGSHIREHIRESYYVPSLLWNAFLDAGHTERQAPFYFNNFWGTGDPSRESKWTLDRLARYLRRYIYRQLGMVA
jgi:hypothetical protein